MIGLNRKADKGFTLIELLVVIAIIGLLAAIVIVSLQGPRQTARNVKRQADLRNLQTAMELCYGDSTCQGQDEYIEYINYAAAQLGGIGVYVPPSGMPSDPGGGSVEYAWQDNTASGITNQAYCIVADMEDGAEDVAYWVSNEGAGFHSSLVCP